MEQCFFEVQRLQLIILNISRSGKDNNETIAWKNRKTIYFFTGNFKIIGHAVIWQY